MLHCCTSVNAGASPTTAGACVNVVWHFSCRRCTSADSRQHGTGVVGSGCILHFVVLCFILDAAPCTDQELRVAILKLWVRLVAGHSASYNDSGQVVHTHARARAFSQSIIIWYQSMRGDAVWLGSWYRTGHGSLTQCSTCLWAQWSKRCRWPSYYAKKEQSTIDSTYLGLSVLVQWTLSKDSSPDDVIICWEVC